MDIFVESLFDAVLDCIKVLPILFLAYLLVSFLSHDHSHKFSKFLSKNRKTSVFYAALLGCVPQCGFSSVMADLYSEKRISLGTLVSIFVATSDEAIPIMLSHSDHIVDMLILIGIKIVLAIFWGYLIDGVVALFRRKKDATADRKIVVTVEKSASANHHAECHCHEDHHGEEMEVHDYDHKSGRECDCSDIHPHECGHIHTEKCQDSCGHSHGNCCVNNVFIDAFLHTFSILIYIFVSTFAINLIVSYCGTQALENLLTTNVYLQIVFASLIGLIPNCASSVLLVELFVFGSLSFPALLAGLTSGAGVGLVILLTKNKKHPLQNLGILGLQYAIGVVSGLIVSLFMI